MADISWVTPRIAISSKPDASWIPTMRRQGITDVLDLRGEPSANGAPEVSMADVYVGTGIRYFYDPMPDHGGVEPASAYDIGVNIIYAALARPGTKILVHCAAGTSRSPSMVYAYLRFKGMDRASAWNAVLRARPNASEQYVSSADAALRSIKIRSPGGVVGLLCIAALAAAGLYYSSR